MPKNTLCDSYKIKDCILIGFLIALITTAVMALLIGGQTTVLMVMGIIIVFLSHIVLPRCCILMILPLVFTLNDIANGIVQRLSQTIILDAVSAVISTIGMVNFALTYINAARARKVKGFLLEDVINKFYPRYKWVLVLNGIAACMGRFAGEVGEGVCAVVSLSTMIVCLCYMLRMANEVAFTEKKVWEATSKYISLISQQYDTKNLDGLRNLDVTKFTNSVGYYIAQHYNAKEFSTSYPSCEQEIRSILPLIRYGSNLQEGRNSVAEIMALQAFEAGSADAFQNDNVKQYCYHCGVTRLPYANCLRVNVQEEMRRACGQWRSILDEITDENVKVQAVFNILCIERSQNTKLSGVLGAGLIMYLHHTYIRDLNPAEPAGWDACLRFLRLMYTSSNNPSSERSGVTLDQYTGYKNWLREFCLSLLLTCACLAMLEQASSEIRFGIDGLQNMISASLWETNEDVRRKTTSDNMITMYVYEAFLLQHAMPMVVLSPKNRKERMRTCQVVINAAKNLCAFKFNYKEYFEYAKE